LLETANIVKFFNIAQKYKKCAKIKIPKIRVNPFNKKVCHCIDDRHGYFSFLTHCKDKNT